MEDNTLNKNLSSRIFQQKDNIKKFLFPCLLIVLFILVASSFFILLQNYFDIIKKNNYTRSLDLVNRNITEIKRYVDMSTISGDEVYLVKAKRKVNRTRVLIDKLVETNPKLTNNLSDMYIQFFENSNKIISDYNTSNGRLDYQYNFKELQVMGDIITEEIIFLTSKISQQINDKIKSYLILISCFCVYFIIIICVGMYFIVKEEKDNKNLLNTIINSLSYGLLIFDESFSIEYFNNTFRSVFGYNLEEIQGKKLFLLMDLSKTCKQCEKCDFLSEKCEVQKSLKIKSELDVIKKDGSKFPAEIITKEIQYQGKPKFIITFLDITKRREEDDIKNNFISMVNHELRTPLTSIKGALHLLLNQYSETFVSQAHNLINIAHDNSERLINLTSDILDIEKIAAGKMEFDMQELNLNEIINYTIFSTQNYAEEFNIKFILKKNIPNVNVFADRNRLIQIITNLLSNAAKFSYPNTDVEVNIFERDDNKVTFTIKDYGPGIPEEFKGQIFQKFSQSKTSNRKKKGSGLGLNLCKAMLEKMNGDINFDSINNVGTTFFVTLPSTNLNECCS